MNENGECNNNNYQQFLPISEEDKNLVGFFEVLIKIDKRLQNEAQKGKDYHD